MTRRVLLGGLAVIVVAVAALVGPTALSLLHPEDNTRRVVADRNAVELVLGAAVESDAIALGVWRKESGYELSREDAGVARDCEGNDPVRTASRACIGAIRGALSRSSDVNLRWGPWSKLLGLPVDYENREKRPDPKAWREAFVSVTGAGEENETLLLIYCVRVGKCQASFCRTKALPATAAKSLASLNRACSRKGHWDPKLLDDPTSLGIAKTLDAADTSHATVMQTLWRPPGSDQYSSTVMNSCTRSGGLRASWTLACYRAVQRAIEVGETALLHWYDGPALHEIFISVSDFGNGSQLLLGHCNFGARRGGSPFPVADWVSTGCDDITCPIDAVLRMRSGSDVADLVRACEQTGSSAPMVMGTFVEV